MIDLLRYVMAVDQFRNYHLAARALGMTQSTLSRRIQELEKDLGVRLFNRSRGLEPTEYGRLVLSRAGALVAEVTGLKHTIDQMRGLEKGKLSIAVGPVVAQSWIGDAVVRTLRRYPGLEVQISQREWWDLPAALREREIDLAVGQLNDPAREPDLKFEPFPRRQGMFCCRSDHPLANRKKVTLEDLCAFPLAAPKLPSFLFAVLPANSQFGEFESGLRYFVPRVCTSNLHAVLRIVEQSDAIGLMLPELAAREIKEGSIVILPYKPSWAAAHYGVISLRGLALPPSAVAFKAAAVGAEKSYFGDTVDLKASAAASRQKAPSHPIGA